MLLEMFNEIFWRVHKVSMGIAEVLSAARSPWQNAYVERMIGSLVASASITS
jgi:hypothetical protein